MTLPSWLLWAPKSAESVPFERAYQVAQAYVRGTLQPIRGIVILLAPGDDLTDSPLQVGPWQQKVSAALLASDAYVRSQASNLPQVASTRMGFFHPDDIADFDV